MKKCRACGCTDPNACWDEASETPCFWVEEDLCSKCAAEVRPEDLELARRLALCYLAVQKCLEFKMRPVMVVMQSLEDEQDLTYLSAVEPEKAIEMLKFLIEQVPQIPLTPISLDLQVARTFKANPKPGRN